MSELQGCTDDELRARMADQDAPTRLRATWELATRLGADATREIALQATREPSVGVRRHLIVVLAGLPQVELLTAIARDDPDPRIRTTAAVCLARRVRDDRASVDAVVMRLHDERAPGVSTAIVEALPEGAPPAIDDALARCIAQRRDGSTQAAIVERAIARDGFASAISWIDRHAPRAARLRRPVLARWVAASSVTEVVAALRDAPMGTLVDALALAGDGSIPWPVLAPIAARADLRADAAIVRCARGSAPDALAFFVAALERAREARVVEIVTDALVAAIHFDRLDRELADRALAACEGRVDASPRVAHAARDALASLRWRTGARDPDGWCGYATRRGSITRVHHTDAPSIALRAGDVEIVVWDDTLERVLGALGLGWDRDTLAASEVASLAANAAPWDRALVTDLVTLATRAGSIRIERLVTDE